MFPYAADIFDGIWTKTQHIENHVGLYYIKTIEEIQKNQWFSKQKRVKLMKKRTNITQI